MANAPGPVCGSGASLHNGALAMADFSKLRERYGPKPKPKQLINMAIREDLPGGAEVLDAAASLHEAAISPDAPAWLQRAYRLLQDAREKMSEAVLNPQDVDPRHG